MYYLNITNLDTLFVKKTLDTSTALLEYTPPIMYVRIKEDAEMTAESMEEQFAAQLSLLDGRNYGVLVDGKSNSTVTPEARAAMANHQPDNRKATAILTKHNLATRLVANFYIRLNRPQIPTRIFNEEKEAIEWLMTKLDMQK